MDPVPTLKGAYQVLLDLPFDSETRLRMQPVLCGLRDEIARLTDRPAEEVQNEHEALAALSLTEKVRLLNGEVH